MTTGGSPLEATAYLAPEGLLDQLRGELKNIKAVHERLVIASGPPQASVWAQNVWYAPTQYQIVSIGDAVRILKAQQRNWYPYETGTGLHRRTALIVEQLPHVSAKPLTFPTTVPTAPLGSFMLLGANTLLASGSCSSPFPNGAPNFLEFKVGPPSRAYLKLFEGLTRLGKMPKPGETCLDLGACPGGWTWVIAGLGANVTAYDRAELDPSVVAMPNVTAIKGDAFAAKPDNVGAIDWLFSDVICYPERLLEHVRLWWESGLCKNFVCSLKFQGTEHYGVIPEFLEIPGSQVFHSFNNKHELTWARVDIA